MKALAIACLILLAGCQSTPPGPDYDTSRDFYRYQSWQWLEPAIQYRPEDPRLSSDLTEQRIRSAIATQLDQRGLRQATTGPVVKVQVWVVVEQREQQFTTHYGGWDPWYGYGFGPMMTDTRSIPYEVQTLQVDLYDGTDGKLIWRGRNEQLLDHYAHPAQRNASIQNSVAKILSQFPPKP